MWPFRSKRIQIPEELRNHIFTHSKELKKKTALLWDSVSKEGYLVYIAASSGSTRIERLDPIEPGNLRIDSSMKRKFKYFTEKILDVCQILETSLSGRKPEQEMIRLQQQAISLKKELERWQSINSGIKNGIRSGIMNNKEEGFMAAYFLNRFDDDNLLGEALKGLAFARHVFGKSCDDQFHFLLEYRANPKGLPADQWIAFEDKLASLLIKREEDSIAQRDVVYKQLIDIVKHLSLLVDNAVKKLHELK